MKNSILVAITLILLGCNNNDNNITNNNPNLPDYSFDTGSLINTNLPQFSNLKFVTNYYVLNDNFGINGVVVCNTGNSFSAFEITDPNHPINECSALTIKGTTASCNCNDNNSYSIISGTMLEGTTGQYQLKRYFVDVNANIIRVYN